MKVILKKTGEIKDVSFGYAVNYLFPRGLAVIASEKNLKIFEQKIRTQQEEKERKEKEEKELIKKFENQKVEIKVKTAKKDKLFGRVTEREILQKLGLSPKQGKLILKEPIKKLGVFNVQLKIGSHTTFIKVKVSAEEE